MPEVLPLLQFELDAGITDEEAEKLILTPPSSSNIGVKKHRASSIWKEDRSEAGQYETMRMDTDVVSEYSTVYDPFSTHITSLSVSLARYFRFGV